MHQQTGDPLHELGLFLIVFTTVYMGFAHAFYLVLADNDPSYSVYDSLSHSFLMVLGGEGPADSPADELLPCIEPGVLGGAWSS